MEKLLYLKEKEYKTEVVYVEYKKIVDIKIGKYINNQCILSLSTKQGRIDAIKKVFGYCYNVPIYVDKNTLLMKVKDKENIWINYLMIRNIFKENDKTVIIFDGGNVLTVDAKYKTVIKNYNGLYNVYLYVQKNLI